MEMITTVDSYLDQFVYDNKLQPADAILVKKKQIGLLNHYILYLGYYMGRHYFMANTLKGIKLFNYTELMHELNNFQPERIEHFVGSDNDRNEAVERAFSRKDENSYHLILNNCEHFKNWVQWGVNASKQVKNWGTAGVVGGVALLASKSKPGKVAGAALLIAGGLMWALSNKEE